MRHLLSALLVFALCVASLALAGKRHEPDKPVIGFVAGDCIVSTRTHQRGLVVRRWRVTGMSSVFYQIDRGPDDLLYAGVKRCAGCERCRPRKRERR